MRFDSPELLDLLYDGVLDLAHFATVLRALVAGHRAVLGSFGLWEAKTDRLLEPHLSVGLPPSQVAIFQERHLSWENPFAGAMRGLKPGQVARTEDLVPFNRLRQTELYREVFSNIGLDHGIALNLTEPDEGLGGLCLFRPRAEGPFDAAEAAALFGLGPHIIRCMRIVRRLQASGQTAFLACDALEQLQFAVFIVNASGWICYINPAGRALLNSRDGLSVVQGRLEALEQDSQTELSNAIFAAAKLRRQRSAGVFGSSVSIKRKSRPPLEIVLAPLAPDRARAQWPSGDLALLLSAGPDCPREGPLRAAFGLTPAEAHLCVLIAEGVGLKEAASRLEVSINTIKTHLQRVFEKTGTRRQAELARLLLAHPARLLGPK